MTFHRTTSIDKILAMTRPIKIIQGSTFAGKTHGIIPVLIDQAALKPALKITVVCETYPGVREVADDIFKSIMHETNRWVEERWRANPMEYTFANGSRIQFRAFDSLGKAKASGKRDILFINEANHLKYEVADALIVRSSEVYIDYNPNAEFWVHTELLGQSNAELLKLTFRDNEACPQSALEMLRMRKAKAYYDPEDDIKDPDNIKSESWANWWTVYGEGELGILVGQIFDDLEHVNHFPPGRAVYGIDWGYTHDPTVCVKLKRHQGKLYRKQLFYRQLFDINADEKGVKILIDAMYAAGVDERDTIIVDNDKIAAHNLTKAGFNVLFADKRAGSVESGINALKNITICTTSDSREIIDEENKYMWELKNGKPTGRPIDAFNHGWDATRYAYDYILNPQNKHYLSQMKKRQGLGRRRLLYAG